MANNPVGWNDQIDAPSVEMSYVRTSSGGVAGGAVGSADCVSAGVSRRSR